MIGMFDPFSGSARVDLSNYFTKDEVQDLVNGINKFEIEFPVELPQKGNKYTFYFIKKKDGKNNDYYDEYYDTTQDGNWEHLGSTDIDLSGYATESSVKSITDSLAESVAENSESLKNKVDKVVGKQLSTNDFTTAEKNKLSGLSNYNDTKVKADISANAEEIKGLKEEVNSFLKDLPDDLNTGKEIVDYIQTLNNKESALETKVNTNTSSIATNKSAIETNKKAIAENKTAIAANKTAIETNTSSIATNKSNLSTAMTSINEINNKLILATATNDGFMSKEDKANLVQLLLTGPLISDDTTGVCVDYENKTYTRIAGAATLNMGEDFNKFNAFGGRKRCNVADDGTINAYYGDEGYKEDGSNGQVMVYQPKFYYKVLPLKLDKIESGGHHLRKANYYISDIPRDGFKVHPAFTITGEEKDYVLVGAFEASLQKASDDTYITNDAAGDMTNDKLSSIGGVKPCSGLSQNLTRANVEKLAKNRGEGWHSIPVQVMAMEQLLMMIELAGNFQDKIGLGVVNIADNSVYNCSANTGSTAGNSTNAATSTTVVIGDTTNTYTNNGSVSVSYRGVENEWGNIWKFIDGINIWGNGSMGGGRAWICNNLSFAESKKTDNYEEVGFNTSQAAGYISAFGYDPGFDWLFLTSETKGNSSVPVGDYYWRTKNLNGWCVALLGGRWNNGANAGAFSWSLDNGASGHSRSVGARLCKF